MSTQASDSVGAPDIENTVWRIDPERSSVEFHSKAFYGIGTVKGHFSRYQGTLHLTGEPAIELTIEADSLDTKHKQRDKQTAHHGSLLSRRVSLPASLDIYPH